MNKKLNCIIIVPTNSTYIDVCKNFLSLLRINWKDCDYKIVFSICGENKKIFGYETIYNGKNATLPECVINASNKYFADYYFIFLGDAFITQKINGSQVEQCLREMNKYNINYCRLLPQYACKKSYAGENLRYLHVNERYGHSFIAFIATKNFIETEFEEGMSDRDFEIKYLELANKSKENCYFKDRVIMRRNIFHIMPGIEKGKWDRIVLKKLKHKYPEIDFAQRELVSVKKQMILLVRRKVKHLVPNNVRKIIKKRLRKEDLFDTEN